MKDLLYASEILRRIVQGEINDKTDGDGPLAAFWI